MRRRCIVSRKAAKPRPRKTATPERGTASNAVRRVSSSATDLQKQLERQARELEESRDKRAALAEVLRIISSSPGELEPVFQAMLENATRLCEASFGNLFLREREGLRNVAIHGAPLAFVEARRKNPLLKLSEGSNTSLNQMAETKRAVQIADIRNEPSYGTDQQRHAFLNQTGLAPSSLFRS